MTNENLKSVLLEIRRDYFHVVLMLAALDPKHAEYKKHDYKDRTKFVHSILKKAGEIQGKFIQTVLATSEIPMDIAGPIFDEVLKMSPEETIKTGLKKPIAQA